MVWINSDNGKISKMPSSKKKPTYCNAFLLVSYVVEPLLSGPFVSLDTSAPHALACDKYTISTSTIRYDVKSCDYIQHEWRVFWHEIYKQTVNGLK